jgi:hypothetical protein
MNRRVGLATSRSTHWDLVGAGVFFALFVALAVAGTNDAPILSDNQHYFFIAERAASGIPPHVSHFDPKNALSMLITAGAINVSRALGGDDLEASRVLSMLVAALAVALLWPLARKLTGSAVAALIACTGMLSLNRFMFMAIMGSQPKVFLVFFVVLSMYALASGRHGWAGVAASAAFLCWQPALALVAAGPLAIWAGGGGRRAGFVFLAAAFVPVLLYEAYFFHHDALGQQLFQAYAFPSSYMESMPTKLAPVIRRTRWFLGIANGFQTTSIVPVGFLIWLAVVWSGWWRPGSRVFRAARGRPDRIYLALIAHAAALLCVQSYQGFPDRFFLEPSMVLATGWVGAWIVASMSRAVRITVGPGLVAAGCAVVLVVLAADGHWDFRRINGLAEQRRLGEAVGRLLDAGYSVYAVGCTHLLAFNRTDNYTPFGFFFRGVGEYIQVKTSGRDYRPLRDGKPPRIILLSRGKYFDELQWFRRRYVRAKRDDFTGQSIEVWLRKTRRQ